MFSTLHLQTATDVFSFVAMLGVNALAIAMSFEKLGFFQKLSPALKSLFVFLIVTIVVPVGSDVLTQLLKGLPATTLEMVQHYFTLLQVGWYTWAGSQYAHGWWNPLAGSAPVV